MIGGFMRRTYNEFMSDLEKELHPPVILEKNDFKMLFKILDGNLAIVDKMTQEATEMHKRKNTKDAQKLLGMSQELINNTNELLSVIKTFLAQPR